MWAGVSRTVPCLGLAQTIAWASSFYLPAILAAPMARDLGLDSATIFAAFSAALLLSAPLAPISGHLIDRWGGRSVLMGTNVLFAAGLVALSSAQGGVSVFVAWLILGVAMGCGLYDAAFATLARLHGAQAAPAIAQITLIAGFASTVGWPLSAWMELRWGWRAACGGWAAVHLLVALPLNALVGTSGANVERPAAAPPPGPAPSPAAGAGSRWTPWVLALVFAITYFVSVALAAHLPGMLQVLGVSLVAAVTVGALMGPSQVAGRVLEIALLHRLHPIWSARIAASGFPLGAALLLWLGPGLAVAFAVLHGLGNGIMTIVRGTLPLAVFGPSGYGRRQGWLMVPTRFLSALAPYLTGLALQHWGVLTWWVLLGLGTAAFAALLWLRPTHADLAQ